MRKAILFATVLWALVMCLPVTFSAEASEPLQVEAADGIRDLTVDYNGVVTLRVTASGGSGAYRYSWELANTESVYEWSGSMIDSADQDYVTIGPITQHCICTAVVHDADDTDPFSVGKRCEFSISVENGLTVDKNIPDSTFKVVPGTDLELEVVASCTTGGLTYEWRNGNNVPELMPDSTNSPRYTWKNIQKSGRAICYVIDQYHNYVSYQFRAEIDSGLKVSAKGSLYRFVKRGESLTLEVEASCRYGSITRYNWRYQNADSTRWYFKNDTNSDTCTFENFQKNGVYACTVYDSYGNSENVSYKVFVVDDVPDGSLSAELDISPTSVEVGDQVTLSWNVTGASEDSEVTVIWTVPGRRDSQLDHAALRGERMLYPNAEGTIDAYVYIHDPDRGVAVYSDASATVTKVSGEMPNEFLFLPRDALIIEDEAFLNTASSVIDVPDSVQVIGQNAFPQGATLIVGPESFARGWAEANGYDTILRQ